MSVGPILTGGEDRRPRFLAIHPPDQIRVLLESTWYLERREAAG